MTTSLPLFPLKLVAFPEENLNLHIFEPRYRQMIRECLEQGTTFGIPPHHNNKVMDYGTELKLLEIAKEHPDGAMDIKTKGIGVFKVVEFFSKFEDKLYPGGYIQRLSIDYEADFSYSALILERVTELFSILKIKKPVPQNTSRFNTYQVAHHVGFTMEQEYEFLQIPNEVQRQEFMLAHLKKLIPIVQEMETLRKRVQMNGHFKNIQPPNF